MTRRLASGSGRWVGGIAPPRSAAMSVATLAALGVALAAASCNGAGTDGPRSAQVSGGARVGGAVISTVDGRPITVSDVQDLVSHSGLAPAEALRRLQAERLLMIEAERLAYGRSAAVDWVARQARVQALLESAASEATVDDDEIRAAYEQAKMRFDRPELRVAVHVLASPLKPVTPEADAAARAFAAEAIADLARTQDVRAFLKAVRRTKTPEFAVSAEALPAVPRTANLVPAFVEAMFSLSSPGVVPEPVKTPYGWHAIRVLQIHPAVSTPYAEAAEQLRPELILARKKEIVDELIAGARKQHRVELSGELRETLAKLEL